MATYLVTGGMGFVGSHLCKGLLDAGHDVLALDLFEAPCAAGLKETGRFRMVVGSVLDRPLLQKLVDESDVVCHLAAVAEPDEYVTRPRHVMDISLLGALDLIRMVRGTGKKFFFTSTSEIYGRNPSVPFSEDDDRVLGSTDVRRWCYSTSKAAVEHYLKACTHEGELDHLIVRLFNVYGPRLKGRVVSRYVDAVVNNEPLVVHGTGKQTRCFTYVADAIDAFIRLMESPTAWNASYNVGTTVETSVAELARCVLNVARLPQDRLKFIPHATAMGTSYEDIDRRVPDVTRIKEAIGWSATTPLNEGIRLMLQDRMGSENEAPSTSGDATARA